MKNNKIISVVIPCYKVKKHIKKVIEKLPEFIDNIIVIDDNCPQKSGKYVEALNYSKVIIIYHKINQGVGGAVISGYKKALELNSDIIIKLDGDGQMDPNYIEKLITPLINDQADYTKGNRFKDFKALSKMPIIRLLGNSILSFIVKGASGYWNIMDPTNGFTAINKSSLEELNLDKIDKRYFFEIDMLINLNIDNRVVKDIYMPAIYGDEESSLNIKKTILKFPFKILKRFLKRVIFKYYLFDFNMASLYMLIGIPMLLSGSIFGILKWCCRASNEPTPTGTVMLAVLPIILGIEFLLQAINIDINNIPKKKD